MSQLVLLPPRLHSAHANITANFLAALNWLELNGSLSLQWIPFFDKIEPHYQNV